MYLPLNLPQFAVFQAASFVDPHGGDPDNHFDKLYKAIVQWILNAFTAAINWLKAALKTAVNWIKTAWMAAVAWIHDTWPQIVTWLTATAATASQPLKEHPHVALATSGLVFLGPQILLLPLVLIQSVFLLLLTVIGFGVSGIVGGSPAARYQSLCYGGNTPASSLFAILQSLGMKYNIVTLSNWYLAIVRLLAGFLFVYVVVGMTVLW
ncbi:hypothetical protein C8R43DRAFT_989752 [Mycena crocata]|nr:hypothetical protein C8R43DRAFT_989752 [Mycena crocata]